MLNIYKASAGSGKTFTLAREYIRYLLGVRQPDGSYKLKPKSMKQRAHDSILAITFTNKATEEMKSRIIRELALLAQTLPGEKSAYLQDFLRDFKTTAKELQQAASHALSGILMDYQFFHVATIDSFFQQVLRTFAREADLHGGYDVQLDNKLVYAIAVDSMLDDVNRYSQTPENKQILNWVEAMMRKNIDEDGKSFNIFNRSLSVHLSIIEFIDHIINEQFIERREEMMDYLNDREKLANFAKAIRQEKKELKEKCVNACTVAVKTIESNNASSGISAYAKNMLNSWKVESDYRDLLKNSLSKMAAKGLEDIGGLYVKKQTGRTPQLDDALLKACQAITECYEMVHFYDLVAADLYKMGLVGEIMKHVDEFRRENQMIMLSDTGEILKAILGEGDAPFVYERMGTRYNNYLIDEFQDTSRLQWQNLTPLVEESLANGNDDLVIGDVKQSIYRFRNSDASLLQHLHEEYPEYATVRGEDLKDNTNWRSSREVVQFNNTIFPHLAETLSLSEEYKGVVQQISKKHSDRHGYVKVVRGGDEESAMDQMVEEISRQLNSGYRPCDIAILTRTTGQGQKVVQRILSLRDQREEFHDIKIATDKSLLLTNSSAVRLILSILRYLAVAPLAGSKRNGTRLQLARLLSTMEFAIAKGVDPNDALLQASLKSLDYKEEEIEDAPRDELMKEVLDMDCVNLSSVVERIIVRFVSEKDRYAQNSYLSAFQDLVSSFTRHGTSDIPSFLEWWDSFGVKETVPASPDDNAINVLTIHKAKGLEYPCVHIPFASLPFQPIISTEWFDMSPLAAIPGCPPMLPIKVSKILDGSPLAEQYREMVNKQQMDVLNLLYVACTRAVKELIISTPPPAKKQPSIGPMLEKAIEMCPNPQSPEQAALSFNEEDIMELGEPTLLDREETKHQKSENQEMPIYQSTDNAAMWEGTQLEDAYDPVGVRTHGVTLHAVMSRLRDKGDVERAVMSLVKDGILLEDEKEDAIELVQCGLADPKVSRWFENPRRVLAERSIITDKGTYRPDRVVWTSDGYVDIVDFKFGKHSSAYASQVRQYMDLFLKMGYEKVRGFLWYMEGGEIKEVFA